MLDQFGSVIAAAAVLILLVFMVTLKSGASFEYFDLLLLIQGGTTLAIAAIGGTLVILGGGFDLSVGAVISLVNVVLASQFIEGDGPGTFLAMLVLAIGIGSACGLVNGLLVAYLRLQSIVVTLATMFILQGVTLLIMDSPGGEVPGIISSTLMGDLIPDVMPTAGFMILACLGAWAWLKRTPYGLHLYAVGGNMASASAVGIRIRRVLLLKYCAAGALYGLAGLFLTAQTGSGDPLVGNSLLLPVFAAIVIGGTRLGGGRGGPLGSVLGAYILMVIVNLLLIFSVSAYYSTIAQGVVLIIAVLLNALGSGSPLREFIARTLARMHFRRTHGRDRRNAHHARPGIDIVQSSSTPPPHISLAKRYRKDIMLSVPALIALILIVLATAVILDLNIFRWSYWNSLIVLSTFLIILALGQGAVILTGGLDLSLPWTIALCAFIFTGITQGSNENLAQALILVTLTGLAIGLLNGIMVAVLGFSSIVATLATNGILQGLALLYSQGTPSGFPAPAVSWLMTAKLFGITPIAYLMLLFVAFAVFLLTCTPFGRQVYATGSNLKAAHLSGVPANRILILVFVLSSLCAALVGVLLTGFSGQASLGMGDDFLLPSIAVIVVGGGLITGGRGHYLGMLAGVLLLTALQMLLSGSGLPYAVRPIIFGSVLLLAVASLKERFS